MSYTPIGWQTGDTITAEKLNQMDNGWGTGTTQLFSETVTTEAGIEQQLTYSQLITNDTITVEFGGTEYVCTNLAAGSISEGEFGAPYSTELGGYDFSEYPFNLYSEFGTNYLITESSGTFAISVTADALQVSSDFNDAVNKCVDASTIPLLCVSGVTTYSEMAQVVTDQNRLMFFFADGKFFIITEATINDINFIPENSHVSATFVNNIFTVTMS